MSNDQMWTRPEYTLEDYMNATGSAGPLAYQWEDKPHRLVFDLCGEIRALEAENAKMREALEKLARLGNEPHYGNSVGNMIARAALGDDA